MSTSRANRRYLLARRPSGHVTADDFHLEDVMTPALEEGQALVEVDYLSIDPAMRGWMNDVRSYIAPVALGDVMRAFGAGHVVASRAADLPVGTVVSGTFGVQHFAVTTFSEVDVLDERVPIEKYLSVLGLTGFSAYFGLIDVGHPRAGDTVVVSAAAGGVGSLVVQIAKALDCHVVGIAGGAEKCRYLLDELGCDGAIDYHEGHVTRALRRACPDGIDVFFDNVGGPILDDGLANLARGARVVVCGAASQYNNDGRVFGPSNYMSLLVNRASMTGFVVFDYEERYPEALAQLTRWYELGVLRSTEEVHEGLENFPNALTRLFEGAKTGKLLLRVTQ